MTVEYDKSAAEQPVRRAFAITPSNTVDLEEYTQGIHVGVAGDVKVDLVDGSTVTFDSLANGYHPIRAKRVYATGTAATDLTGLIYGGLPRDVDGELSAKVR